MSVSCPMTPASAPGSLSGFCSYLGITLKIDGSQSAVGTYSIKGERDCVLISVKTHLVCLRPHRYSGINYIVFAINGRHDVTMLTHCSMLRI